MPIKDEDFVHLHVHSDFSIIDGVASVKSLVEKAAKYKHKAIALTDHGSVAGSLALCKAARDKGLKPIIGLEAYLCDDMKVREKKYNHITLLAQSEEGYRNLAKMSSLAHMEGFYYKARVDWDTLAKHSEGIIALSGCLKGAVSVPILHGEMNNAIAMASRMRDIYQDRLFFEVQPTPIDKQYIVNDACIRLSIKMGIPLAATCDVHYVNQEDAVVQDIKLCISNGKHFNDSDRWRIKEGLYYKSTKEMLSFFSHIPEAITNTRRIADMIDFEIPTADKTGKYYLPKFECPDGLSEQGYFDILCEKGLKERYGDKLTDAHWERLHYEARVIKNSGYVSYFLIVQDFIGWARANNIPVGPGRGCLTERSFVFTNNGYKSIRDVVVGVDKTINEYGILSEVVDKLEYDVSEDIFTLKCYYDFWSSSQFTGDHKILIKEGDSPDVYGKTLFPSDGKNAWTRCRDIEPGDYVCIPKFNNFKHNEFSIADLSIYADKLCIFVDDKIIERTNVNHSYKGSTRDVSKGSGISRNCLRDIIIKNPKVRESSKRKLVDYLRNNKIAQDIDQWIDYIKEKKEKTSSLPRLLSQDENYAKFIGLWIGDGSFKGTTGLEIALGTDDYDAIKFLDNYLGTILNVRFTKIIPKGKASLIIYSLQSRILNKHLKALFGDVYSDTKFIPEFFMENKSLASALLVGLVWADGSVKEARVQYDTVSERLMYDVRRLAYYLNTPSSVSKRNYNKAGQENWKDSYRVRFARSQIIQDLFGIGKPVHGFYFEDDTYMYCAVMKISQEKFKGKVYDLTIAGSSPSFLTGGYIVHNSAAGSIIAYSLRITDIDPLKYDLLFERFLNPDRVSMPDIDIDFCEENRERVIQYVRNKYRDENVCQIITYGTMKAKQAIKDVCRIFEVEYQEANRVTKAVPKDATVRDFRKTDVGKLYDSRKEYTQIFDYAERIEGMIRHTGIHAAGVVIADTNLLERIPLSTVTKKGEKHITTQYTMGEVEDVGLLKMDFLGLRTLTVIHDTEKFIRERHGIPFRCDQHVDIADPEIYKTLSSGHTKGIFQVESKGFQELLKKMKPDSINDIIAAVALYRPGPLGSQMDKHYTARKHGEEPIVYAHPCLEPILKETYGGILYQEQVMTIANKCAGFTLPQADTLRKAMGKKKLDVMEKMKIKFIDGMVAVSKVEAATAQVIWDQIVFFASYGFNKSHSAAYGMLTIYTAYLKTHYPLEYMTATLSSYCGKRDSLVFYMDECRRMGIPVLPPDIRHSESKFTIRDNSILYGLRAVKGVGIEIADSILDSRKRVGEFKSIYHFVENVLDIKEVTLENLIKAGALNCFGHKAQMLAAAPEAIECLRTGKKKKKKANQVSLFFDEEMDMLETIDAERLPVVPEWDAKQIQEAEKEVFDLYLTSHPLDDYMDLLRENNTHSSLDLAMLLEDDPEEEIDWDEIEKNFTIGGMIKSLKVFQDKRNKTMARITIEDHLTSVDAVVFASVYEVFGSMLQIDAKLFFDGVIQNKDGRVYLLINAIHDFSQFETLRKRNQARNTEKVGNYRAIEEQKAPLPKTETLTPKPELKPEPEIVKPEPEIVKPEPEIVKPEPEPKEDPMEQSSFTMLKKQAEDLGPKFVVEMDFPLETMTPAVIDQLEKLFNFCPGNDVARYRFRERGDMIFELDKRVRVGKNFTKKLESILEGKAYVNIRGVEEESIWKDVDAG